MDGALDHTDASRSAAHPVDGHGSSVSNLRGLFQSLNQSCDIWRGIRRPIVYDDEQSISTVPSYFASDHNPADGGSDAQSTGEHDVGHQGDLGARASLSPSDVLPDLEMLEFFDTDGSIHDDAFRPVEYNYPQTLSAQDLDPAPVFGTPPAETRWESRLNPNADDNTEKWTQPFDPYMGYDPQYYSPSQ